MPQVLTWKGPGAFQEEIVGESHYQPALKRLAGGEKRQPATARLICESNNPHDANAVRVEISGQTVGHLPRDEAPAHRKRLAALQQAGAIVECDAVIVTGRDGLISVYLDLPIDEAADEDESEEDNDESIAIAPVQKARRQLSRRQQLWAAFFLVTGLMCCCLALIPKK